VSINTLNTPGIGAVLAILRGLALDVAMGKVDGFIVSEMSRRPPLKADAIIDNATGDVRHFARGRLGWLGWTVDVLWVTQYGADVRAFVSARYTAIASGG